MGDVVFWTAQAVGVVAALLGVFAFQIPRRRAMLAMLGGSALTWSVHFLLLAAPAAAGINFVTGLRNVCGIGFRGSAPAFIFGAFYISAAFVGWRSLWDLLPLAAVLSGTVAVFRLDGLAARSGFLIGSLLWVIYNFHVGSIAGVLIMFADAASNARFIYARFREGQDGFRE